MPDVSCDDIASIRTTLDNLVSYTSLITRARVLVFFEAVESAIEAALLVAAPDGTRAFAPTERVIATTTDH